MKDQLKQLEAFIESRYCPSDGGLTAESSWGNNNDVFDDGYVCGYTWALYQVAQLIGLKVEEPYPSEDECPFC